MLPELLESRFRNTNSRNLFLGYGRQLTQLAQLRWGCDSCSCRRKRVQLMATRKFPTSLEYVLHLWFPLVLITHHT